MPMPNKLKVMILDCVQHYKCNHTDFADGSHCLQQVNYEPRHQKLQDDVSIRLLTKVVEDSVINKKSRSIHLQHVNRPFSVIQ